MLSMHMTIENLNILANLGKKWKSLGTGLLLLFSTLEIYFNGLRTLFNTQEVPLSELTLMFSTLEVTFSALNLLFSTHMTCLYEKLPPSSTQKELHFKKF
jgi:hypothetical protein